MTGYQSKRAAAQDKLVRMTKDEALKLALEALEQTLQTLDDENSKPGGAIADTIWHTEHETLFDYLGSEITAIKEALVQPEQEPVSKYCCHFCFNESGQAFFDRMILCPECGNKRCPRATNHKLQCTNSNEPNQAGSVYTPPPQPAQEPVAWMYDWFCDGKLITDWIAHSESEIPKTMASNIRLLYTAPPQEKNNG